MAEILKESRRQKLHEKSSNPLANNNNNNNNNNDRTIIENINLNETVVEVADKEVEKSKKLFSLSIQYSNNKNIISLIKTGTENNDNNNNNNNNSEYAEDSITKMKSLNSASESFHFNQKMNELSHGREFSSKKAEHSINEISQSELSIHVETNKSKRKTYDDCIIIQESPEKEKKKIKRKSPDEENVKSSLLVDNSYILNQTELNSSCYLIPSNTHTNLSTLSSASTMPSPNNISLLNLLNRQHEQASNYSIENKRMAQILKLPLQSKQPPIIQMRPEQVQTPHLIIPPNFQGTIMIQPTIHIHSDSKNFNLSNNLRKLEPKLTPK
jgi:hypothetical protein